MQNYNDDNWKNNKYKKQNIKWKDKNNKIRII